MDVWFGREEGRSLKLKHRVVGLEALKGSLIRVWMDVVASLTSK
jgi:hypothetical protein